MKHDGKRKWMLLRAWCRHGTILLWVVWSDAAGAASDHTRLCLTPQLPFRCEDQCNSDHPHQRDRKLERAKRVIRKQVCPGILRSVQDGHDQQTAVGLIEDVRVHEHNRDGEC